MSTALSASAELHPLTCHKIHLVAKVATPSAIVEGNDHLLVLHGFRNAWSNTNDARQTNETQLPNKSPDGWPNQSHTKAARLLGHRSVTATTCASDAR